jgi:phosphoribosyl 1,2-cyclic phosphate phosphodiesterase
MAALEGLDVLVLDALRTRPHVSHYSLDEALAVVEQLRPKRTLLTHISHEMAHAATSATLPPGVEFAYDGLVVPLT